MESRPQDIAPCLAEEVELGLDTNWRIGSPAPARPPANEASTPPKRRPT